MTWAGECNIMGRWVWWHGQVSVMTWWAGECDMMGRWVWHHGQVSVLTSEDEYHEFGISATSVFTYKHDYISLSYKIVMH